MKFTSAVSLLSLLSIVSAHGTINSITVHPSTSSKSASSANSKTFAGAEPGKKLIPSPIRQLNTISPNHLQKEDPDNMICGNGGKGVQKGSLVADLNGGDKVDIHWVAGNGQKWPHQWGPMLTYMASCGDVSCDKFDPSEAKWFKIDQVAQKRKGGDAESWFQDDLFEGKSTSVTIPRTIKPGNYLLRHEIIALHLADQVNGAELYPQCIQTRVVASEGEDVPEESELIQFGKKGKGYGVKDKGIFVNVFNDGFDYAKQAGFPGPKIAKFVAGGSSNSSASPSAVPDNASPSTSGKVAGEKSPCKHKSGSSNNSGKKVAAGLASISVKGNVVTLVPASASAVAPSAIASPAAVDAQTPSDSYKKRRSLSSDRMPLPLRDMTRLARLGRVTRSGYANVDW